MEIIDSCVSIVTPSYNSANFISQAIESVIKQTHKNWEMIIVDDASPDNANDFISKYIEKDSRIKLIKLEKNSGAAVARNMAIKEAKGKYIAFLDADDLWLPKKLEKQISFLSKNNLSFTYSSYYVIDKSGKDLSIFTTKEVITYVYMLKTNSVGCLTAIYDAHKIGKHYMTNVGHEDYALWLKILKNVGYAYGIQESLAKYRVVNSSVSRNKFQTAQWQWHIYRKIEKLNLLKSIYYFMYYAWNGVKKYRK